MGWRGLRLSQLSDHQARHEGSGPKRNGGHYTHQKDEWSRLETQQPSVISGACWKVTSVAILHFRYREKKHGKMDGLNDAKYLLACSFNWAGVEQATFRTLLFLTEGPWQRVVGFTDNYLWLPSKPKHTRERSFWRRLLQDAVSVSMWSAFS